MLLYLHTAGHMKSEGCSELSGPVKCRFVDCMLEGVVVDIGIIETLVLVCVASGKKKTENVHVCWPSCCNERRRAFV